MKRDLDRLCLLLLAALLMSLMAATPSLAVVVWSEDFEGLTLGDSQDEGRFAPVGPVAPTDPPTADPDPIPNVWTDVAPTGWTVDRSGVPGYNNPPDNNGVKEWIGWNFADKGFWNDIAGQGRGDFTNATGTVMVADDDEWDDAPHPDSAANGWYNTTADTLAVPLTGLPAGVLKLSFDSSWRPEFDSNYHQRAAMTVSYDGAAPIEVLNWKSDPASPNFHPDSRNETVSIDLDNPAGAKSMVIQFGLFDAGNDWWWAIDNISLDAPAPLTLRVDPNSGAMELRGNLDLADVTGYEITSPSGSLDPAGWQAGNLAAQNIDPVGAGPGESWESLFFTSNQLAESFLLGSSAFDATRVESLGTGFNSAGTPDLVFEFSQPDGSITQGVVEYATIYQDADFNEDGVVDGTDLSTWQAGFGQFDGAAAKTDGDANDDGFVGGSDFLIWQRQLDRSASNRATAVPEPAAWVLFSLALAGLAVIRGRPYWDGFRTFQ